MAVYFYVNIGVSQKSSLFSMGDPDSGLTSLEHMESLVTVAYCYLTFYISLSNIKMQDDKLMEL